MALHRQPTPDRRPGSVEIGGIQMGSLGRVASTRGVQLIAVDGLVNDRVENQFTTTLRFLDRKSVV